MGPEPMGRLIRLHHNREKHILVMSVCRNQSGDYKERWQAPCLLIDQRLERGRQRVNPGLIGPRPGGALPPHTATGFEVSEWGHGHSFLALAGSVVHHKNHCLATPT